MNEPEQIPAWAQTLIREVTILNERLPNHVDWTERNIKDHELRIRSLEQFKWMIAGLALASGGVGAVLAKLLGA